MVVTNGAKLQSYCHHQQINTQRQTLVCNRLYTTESMKQKNETSNSNSSSSRQLDSDVYAKYVY